MKKIKKMNRKKTIQNTENNIERQIKKPSIPIDTLDNFIGYVKNLSKIDCKWVFTDGDGDRYRINVYTEHYEEGSVYPRLKIEKSFSVYYDGTTLIDKT